MIDATLEYKAKKNALIFLILSTIFYTFEQIILGPYSYLFANDTAMHAFPKRMAVIKDFYEHGLSFWFPYVSGGADMYTSTNLALTATRESSLLMFILPAWLAFQLTIFFAIFFAGYFTFLIASKHLKLSWNSSLFAGFLYQACTPYYFDIAISFLPFFIFYFEKFIQKNINLKNIILFFILSIFYASTIGIVHQFSCLLCIFFWSLFINYDPKKNSKKILYFIILLIVIGLYFLPQLLSLKENSITSHRILNLGDSSFCTNLIWCLEPKHVMNSAVFKEKFFPWGVYLIIIIISGLYNYKQDVQAFVISIFLFIFSFGTILVALIFKKFILQFDFLLFLKGLNIYRWGEPYSFVYVLGLMLTTKKIILKTNKSIVVLFLIPLIIFFTFDQFKKRQKNFEIYLSKSHSFTGVFENTLLKDLSKKIKEDEPFRAQNYPGETISISWLAGYGIEEAGGMNYMVLAEYLDLWNTMVHKNYSNYEKFRDSYTLSDKYPSSEFLNFSSISQEDFYNYRKNNQIIDLDKHHNMKLLSLMNVKYIYSSGYIKSEFLKPLHIAPEYLIKPGFSRIKLNEKIKNIFGKKYNNINIYENKFVLPRVYFVNNVRCFNNKKDLLNHMANSNLDELKTTGHILNCNNISEKEFDIDIKKSKLEIIKYSPDQINLNLDVMGKGIMIVSNAFHNSWKAYSVNNEEIKIFKINHAFWGIEVDSSYKNIYFRYEPEYIFNNLMYR